MIKLGRISSHPRKCATRSSCHRFLRLAGCLIPARREIIFLHARVRETAGRFRRSHHGHWAGTLEWIERELAGSPAGRYSDRTGQFDLLFSYRYLSDHQHRAQPHLLSVPSVINRWSSVPISKDDLIIMSLKFSDAVDVHG